ncbi:MAG: anaerobic ribonucleoside-triphosphate reductase activating protein [Oscillospiraceae bacterium]|nr:anaerobic ribonucleoside-triphosphate reductase activating protein [Oscillospiraceae bacterium]
MHFAAIKPHDVANGPGVRVSLFVSGCHHACPGCFNPEAWSFAYGESFGEPQVRQILSALAPDYIRGLSLLGGEPLHPLNRAAVLKLVRQVRKHHPRKDIWCYTGYDFERELLPESTADPILRQLLEQIDVLVDGRFVEAKKNLNIRFRGSENQRVLNLRASLVAERGVPAEGDDQAY